MTDMLSKRGLAEATDVVVAGSSAGGLGVMMQVGCAIQVAPFPVRYTGKGVLGSHASARAPVIMQYV
jgi:hypothetical protein